jgi:hypothetical protein
VEEQDRFCGLAKMSQVLHSALPILIVACVLSTRVDAQSDAVVEDLRRQLAQRDAEISALRQQVESLQSERTAAPSGIKSPSKALPASPQTADAASTGLTSGRSVRNSANEDNELATALESSLVRQGGAVLSSGTIEFEPELSYFYDEPTTGARRDAFATAITVRFGLPAAMQAEVYVPYVIRDHASGIGSASGIGDVRVGLTKELLKEREGTPALLVFGRWRTTTGDINRNPPTGFGQNAIQIGFTTTKRKDPALLFGSVSYTANLGTARLRNGARLDSGNVFGARLGAYLAATPDTSFYWGVAYSSSNADRFNDERVELTNRARGFLELGSTTIIGRGRFLNIGIGIGVTPAAPRFSFTMSLPIRF